MTKKLDRAYRHKNVQDLTSKDLQEMAEDFRDMEKERARLKNRIEDLQKQRKANEIKLALLESIAEYAGEAIEGMKAAVDALAEYAHEHRQTVHEFFTSPDLPENLAQIRNRALEILQERSAQEEPGAVLPIRPEKIDLPLDKINSNIWNLLENEQSGQMKFNLAGPASAPQEEQEPAFVSINYEALEDNEAFRQIAKKLTPFDKRVYVAIAALHAVGNTAVTFRQIHYAMGNKREPSKPQGQRIENSVIKMMKAVITLNDDIAAKKGNYEAFTRTVNLLYAVIDKGRTYNGLQSRAQVRLLAEPTLITYARRRKQITTIPLKLLQGDYNKTDAFIAIEDYLLEQIVHKKHEHAKSFRMLYETIGKRTRLTDRKQQDRLPEKVERILDYYKTCGYIASAVGDKKGVTVTL